MNTDASEGRPSDRENPYSSPGEVNQPRVESDVNGPQRSGGREAYNLVTDVVAGPNLRWKDNLVQAVVILICLVIGAAVGAIFGRPDSLAWALVGGFVGVLVGLFTSGIVLMVYRLFRH